jgi:hypothetical protein
MNPDCVITRLKKLNRKDTVHPWRTEPHRSTLPVPSGTRKSHQSLPQPDFNTTESTPSQTDKIHVFRKATCAIHIVPKSEQEYFSFIMIQRLHTGSPDRHPSHVTLGLIILLCIGVLAQTLGAPVTLWNPVEVADSADPLTASILEAFSIPSALSLLSPSSGRVLPVAFQSPLHGCLLVSGLFHPPSA